MEKLQQKGYDVLFMTDEVDGFVPQTLAKYQDKELKAITAGDLGLETEEEKKAAEEKKAQQGFSVDPLDFHLPHEEPPAPPMEEPKEDEDKQDPSGPADL